ncbi:pyruvate dehydrogenase complex dihydrolipoamide acetyltransferase [Tropicibacter sp. Alg240-R139]|uniref:pyruvate dehydrogenase complex dihydrolipoamide acetyltransferase n=1 Tax=Tropicibacter sp. Alg240-R139 TaxID=2305991 RepID=UPI0013E07254|nr:pyruvate dehydrogenase complex dihydrolipoamide acetyltransferase [Tropicibacter sp. Alg240-R139]
MPITLTMPALSPTMEEGTLASWLVAEGDRIEAGDVIAEIETDKATMEYEAPTAGVLARIIVSAGSENIAVNTVIALMAEEGEDPGTVLAAEPAEPSKGTSPQPELAASGTSAAASLPTGKQEDDRLKASPLARRIAAEAGVKLASVSGTGPNGRIVRVDVEAKIASGETLNRAATVVPTAPLAAANVSGLYPDGSYEVVKLDTMRKTIARRLTESKQNVPHFYLRADVELDALLTFRSQLNAAAPTDGAGAIAYKISVNDMVIKALAGALREVPSANVTWADGSMLLHKNVDVAVAVAIEGGLITPVVRDADTKSLSAIASEMKDLAARARARKLAPEDFQGGTTSVSNLGMFGVSSFDAVINPPHGTILAVGAGEKRPIVRGDDVAVATIMTVTLSVDHRTVDGALGAELLAAFKRLIENPIALVA